MYCYRDITFLLSYLSVCQCLPDYYAKYSANEIPAYRPVVLVHGLMGTRDSLENVQKFIEQEHPGTRVINPRLHADISSFDSMWNQVETYYNAIKYYLNDTEEVNLVAYSQGGLIARGLIEKFGLKVRNFISLSSPLAGQYGDFGLHYLSVSKAEAYKKFYLDPFFRELSVPQYWNDPHHQDIYLEYCQYLPEINNEIVGQENKDFADNFKALNKLVMIGGPNDDVVSPWQSSYFSFYDQNENVVDFRERDIYKKDLFGLKTLDEQNKIMVYIKIDVGHHDWYKDDFVLRNFVLPWLD